MADSQTPAAWADWYTPPVAAAPAAATPSGTVPPAWADWYTPPPVAPARPQSAEAPTTLSTPAYIGGRALEGAAGAGDALTRGMFGMDSAGNPDVQRDLEAAQTQNSPATMNQQVFGSPSLGASTNAAQHYGGDLAASVAADPVGAAVAPVAAVAGSLASTGASDANHATGDILPDWAARLFGGFAGALGGGYAYLKARGNPPAVKSPLAPGETNKDIDRAIQQSADFGTTPVGKFQDPAEAFANSTGAAVTPSGIGQRIMDKASSWLEGQRKAISGTFDDFEKGMPRVGMKSTTDLLTTPGSGPKLPGVAGEIQDALNQSSGTSRAGVLPDTLSYDEAKAFRSKVGAAMKADAFQGGQDTPRLKQLYGALSQDMEAGIKAKGGDAAVADFNRINKAFGDVKDFVGDRVGNLADGGLTPEKVYSSLASNPTKTATHLQELLSRGVIDHNDIGAIGRDTLAKMGQNDFGHWDPVTFAKSVVELRKASPEAEQLLFRGTPAQSQAYDALVDRAGALGSPAGPLARANVPGPSAFDFIKKLAKTAGTATVASYLPGLSEGGGEALGAMIGLNGHGASSVGSPLYRIPKAPLSTRMIGAPSTKAAAQAALIDALFPPSRPQQ